MPTENNNHIGFTLFGKTSDGEFVPVGELNYVQFALDEAFENDPQPEMSCEGTMTFNWKPQKYSRKTIRWFRQNLGLDLQIIRLPKKKRRREKRLNRKYI